MPKLVKVNNINQTNGQFENIFHEPITIEKNAKVALLNACVDIDMKNIVVDDQNHNGIQFKTAITLPNMTTVHLTNGIYTSAEFTEMMEARMNAGLIYQLGAGGVALSPDVGFQWRVSLDDKRRINIIYDRDSVNGVKNYDASFMKNIALNAGNNYSRTGAGDDWNAGSISKKVWCEGASILEYTRRDAGNNPLPDSDVHIIGLLPTHYEEEMPDFTIDRYHFALANQQIGGNWVYVCKYKNPDGTFAVVNTNVQPADHIIGLMLTEGVLKFFYRLAGGVGHTNITNINVLYEMEWNYPQSLFGGFSIFTALSNIQTPHMWSSPYGGYEHNFENYAYQELARNLRTESDDPNLGATASRVKLTLNDEAMRLLGFTSDPSLKPDQKNGIFLANHTLPDAHIPENLKVILNNVKLDSYDGVKHRRENILLSLPVLVYEGSKILYDRPMPIYLDLKNKDAFTLNSVDISLLDFEDAPIQMLPNQCDITLLFSD